MQVQVPYTAIEFHYFKSGVSLRYCAEMGVYEEHDNFVITVRPLGQLFTLIDEPAVGPGFDEDDFFYD
ncbi:hypothetical protein AQS70_20600 [Pseudomonas endophytica]|uniref:Uncharacterized protein n=1 Tax=Pseudomonas endophytica TaxID=1563157 RepID=A0A0N8VT06_9PSED|nr:hypothetical protein [Pseudomonas endophytica]KQB54788.1 hypothetical protein AQS70_20600 [Pseudomonas endophytica]